VTDDPDVLSGQVFAVAGSSRGIGAALVVRLAELGAAVVVNGRDRYVVEATVEAIRSPGGRAEPVVGSASDAAVAHALVRTAVESFGRLDGVANCAGIAEPPGSSVLSMDSADPPRRWGSSAGRRIRPPRPGSRASRWPRPQISGISGCG
jgi:NAD(P)-dependent dehydrogenase (short-subunit alcohol dehydrogenase family)